MMLVCLQNAFEIQDVSMQDLRKVFTVEVLVQKIN